MSSGLHQNRWSSLIMEGILKVTENTERIKEITAKIWEEKYREKLTITELESEIDHQIFNNCHHDCLKSTCLSLFLLFSHIPSRWNDITDLFSFGYLNQADLYHLNVFLHFFLKGKEFDEGSKKYVISRRELEIKLHHFCHFINSKISQSSESKEKKVMVGVEDFISQTLIRDNNTFLEMCTFTRFISGISFLLSYIISMDKIKSGIIPIEDFSKRLGEITNSNMDEMNRLINKTFEIIGKNRPEKDITYEDIVKILVIVDVEKI